MANIVIVGTQWGDEGKGKIVDLLAEYADYVVRFQGGANAGHTMVVGRAAVHQPPGAVGDSAGKDLLCRQRHGGGPRDPSRRDRDPE